MSGAIINRWYNIPVEDIELGVPIIEPSGGTPVALGAVHALFVNPGQNGVIAHNVSTGARVNSLSFTYPSGTGVLGIAKDHITGKLYTLRQFIQNNLQQFVVDELVIGESAITREVALDLGNTYPSSFDLSSVLVHDDVIYLLAFESSGGVANLRFIGYVGGAISTDHDFTIELSTFDILFASFPMLFIGEIQDTVAENTAVRFFILNRFYRTRPRVPDGPFFTTLDAYTGLPDTLDFPRDRDFRIAVDLDTQYFGVDTSANLVMTIDDESVLTLYDLDDQEQRGAQITLGSGGSITAPTFGRGNQNIVLSGVTPVSPMIPVVTPPIVSTALNPIQVKILTQRYTPSRVLRREGIADITSVPRQTATLAVRNLNAASLNITRQLGITITINGLAYSSYELQEVQRNIFVGEFDVIED